eukprot:TRINITY_DN12122_c0_g1_i3.p1 TRINITY_DN12122_c0_g1~~TRINITY_DN12122_c0_g1_i3.p1  ORF type:complete len:750 (+),score=119.80 TRINITY_DN12122_c0_g1_i3:77-2326(+)
MSCSGSPASFEPHFVQKGSTDPSRTLAVERPRQGRRASPRWRHSARVIGRRFWVTSAAATSAALVTLSRASEQSPSLGGARTDWASQYGQDQLIFDRFFLAEVGDDPPRKRVFVELGAADGLDKSNTLSLERRFGWTGVLIEPSIPLYEELKKNRPGSACVHACVTRVAGSFYFTEDGLNSGVTDLRGTELVEAAMGLPGAGDNMSIRECRTLPDILDEHLGRRAHIDYLSLDLEGGELDVLQSFDFERHTVDIISLEAHTWRSKLRSDRMSRLLERHGFQFLERLVVDEIWIRRRGAVAEDPGCFHPGLRVSRRVGGNVGPVGGWDRIRGVMWELLDVLRLVWAREEKQADLSTIIFKEMKQKGLGEPLKNILDMWEANGDELSQWEAECPAGFLAIGLAQGLLTNFHNEKALDPLGLSILLRKQFLFLPSSRYQGLATAHGNGFQKMAEQSELEGVRFEVRMPMGRQWHEVFFMDALESEWPIFGFLDLVSRVIHSEFPVEIMNIHGQEYELAHEFPRVLCELEEETGTGKIRLRDVTRIRSGRGPRPAIQDIVLDASVCSMIGGAAILFHAARGDVREVLEDAQQGRQTDGFGTSFVGISNWTVAADCQGQRVPYPREARAYCGGLPRADCVALTSGSRPVPVRCLRERTLHAAAGESMFVRRASFIRRHGRLGFSVEKGERLFREFVRRHGFFMAVWAAGSPRLRLPTTEANGFSAPFPDGETLFGALHSLQELQRRAERLIRDA